MDFLTASLDQLVAKAEWHGPPRSTLASNPKLLSAAMSLLSAKSTSMGGGAGLGGLVQAFQQQRSAT